MSTFWINEYRDVSSVTTLHSVIGHHLDCWYEPKKEENPKSFKKSDKTLSSLPEISFCFSLKTIPLSQTLSNAFEISRKTPPTSKPSSKDFYISWFIDESCLIQDYPGLKPDWFEEIKLFSTRNLNISFINN